MNDVFNVNLNKWPAMLVVGEKVTVEQAIEINFRTACSYWSSNDKDFLAFIAEVIGANVGNYRNVEFTDEIREAWGHIPLEYLSNSNIVSSYIGGPHGWCSWDGEIFSNSYNIGKWPTVREVYDDWCRIAEAFPFLNLRCQLMSGECSEERLTALVEFVVKDGAVEVLIPDATPMITASDCDISRFISMLNNRYREHGSELDFVTRYNTFKAIRGF